MFFRIWALVVWLIPDQAEVRPFFAGDSNFTVQLWSFGFEAVCNNILIEKSIKKPKELIS